MSDTLEALATELGLALNSLEGALTPSNTASLLAELGLAQVPELGSAVELEDALDKAAQGAAALSSKIADLIDARSAGDDVAVLSALASLLDAIREFIASLNDIGTAFALATAGLPDAASLAEFASTFASRVLSLAIVSYLEGAHPFLRRILSLAGVVELQSTEVSSNGVAEQVIRKQLHLDRVSRLLTEPGAVLQEVYGWGDAAFDGAALFANARDVFDTLIPVAATHDADTDAPAELELFELRVQAAADTQPPGLATDLFVDSAANLDFTLAALAEDCRLALQIERPLPAGARIAVRPPARLDLPGTQSIAGKIALMLVGESADPTRTFRIFAVPGGTELRAARLSAGFLGALTFDSTSNTAGADLGFEANIGRAELQIQLPDADGFVGSILPEDGLHATFDAGATVSSAGLQFKGAAAGLLTLPVAVSTHGITLSAIHLGLEPQNGTLRIEMSATVSASIGPLTAVLDRVGITGTLALDGSTGNLGVADLSFEVKPPSGVGLAVDASGVVGGGFLFNDPAQGAYAGAMQLTLHDDLTLTAYGLIATQMPDGTRGYSLLIFVTAEGFKPIPLGFGFVLESIGGMLAVNRTFDQDALKAGLQTDSLGALLFPSDPVANAPAIIRALSTAFPARRDSFLLGLLARITWFRPVLVQMDLALILELGSRNRLLALGRVTSLLPAADNDLIRLKLDAIGVLDFDAGTVACDAVLVDSRLAHQFPITGSAALRGTWSLGGLLGVTGSFVLAAGGLNPRFQAPPGFPSLERVAIALCSGNNPRLICEAYLAVTTNTVQFGSRTSLYAEALGFSVSGELSFDALITLLPPHFVVDIHASMQLKRGSHNLFKVTLDGTLEGPLPLRLAARASFEILWISFSVHFDFTLSGGDVAQAVAAAVGLADEVAKALAEASSWSTRLAPGVTHGVTLRGVPSTAARQVLDPLGQLVVQQQVAPLNTGRDVDTFGGAPVSGARRFQVAATLNGVRGTPVQGGFAPARYFGMSDDEKLAAPSFESMDSGVVLGSSVVTFDSSTIVPAPLTYESIVLNPVASPQPPTPPPPYTMPLDVLKRTTSTGAAARVPARRVGTARFRDTAVRPAATLRPPHWRIVQASDGSIRPEQPTLRTWSENRAALALLNRGGAQWLMIPAHELGAAQGR